MCYLLSWIFLLYSLSLGLEFAVALVVFFEKQPILSCIFLVFNHFRFQLCCPYNYDAYLTTGSRTSDLKSVSSYNVSTLPADQTLRTMLKCLESQMDRHSLIHFFIQHLTLVVSFRYAFPLHISLALWVQFLKPCSVLYLQAMCFWHEHIYEMKILSDSSLFFSFRNVFDNIAGIWIVLCCDALWLI